MLNNRTAIRCFTSFSIGAAVSTGHPLAILASVAMPALAVSQPGRLAAYWSAICYYAGASWPVIPAARNFFGPFASPSEGFLAWIVAALLLATPWPIVWTQRRHQPLWRVPVALISTAIPPLGIIGWASPLTAAGFLLPHTSWCGLLGCAILSGALAIWPLRFVAIGATAALALNLIFPGTPSPPRDWQGIDTHFGSISHGGPNPLAEYSAAEWIQNSALASCAHVILFPEMVVPRWTPATDLFWQPTLAALLASGKTIALGAGLPGSSATMTAYDFGRAVAVLRANDSRTRTTATELGWSEPQNAGSYKNAVVIRGAQSGTLLQRVPVPLGMWHLFDKGGVPLNLFGPSVINIAGQRVAVLICYEQLLTWPILVSMLHEPTILLAIANDYWVEGTSIPRYQATAVRAWARLFRLSFIAAVNR